MKTFALAAATFFLMLAAAAHADTHIRVIPSAPAAPVPLAKPDCTASVSRDAHASGRELPDCDADLFAPSMPGGNYNLRFSLQTSLINSTLAPAVTFEFSVRLHLYPADKFRAFDIQLPTQIVPMPVTNRIKERTATVCASGPEPAQLWDALLWMHFTDQFLPAFYDADLQLLRYVSCRALLRDPRTGATVAASILDDRLTVCPGGLQRQLPPRSASNETCVPTPLMPDNETLASLAHSVNTGLLARSIALQNEQILTRHGVLADDTARISALAQALVDDHATVARFGGADAPFLRDAERSAAESMNALVRDSVKILSPAIERGDAPDAILRTRELSDVLAMLRDQRPGPESGPSPPPANIFKRTEFAPADQTIADLITRAVAARNAGAEIDGDRLRDLYASFSPQSALSARSRAAMDASIAAMGPTSDRPRP